MWENELITCWMIWGAWAVLVIVSFPLLTAWVLRGHDVDLERGIKKRQRNGTTTRPTS